MWYKHIAGRLFGLVTKHACDRQTDGRTDGRTDRITTPKTALAQLCRAVKTWGVMQQCVYETKVCDIYDLQKCLTQTWVDSEQNVIEAVIDQWRDRLRSCVRAGGGHFEHML